MFASRMTWQKRACHSSLLCPISPIYIGRPVFLMKAILFCMMYMSLNACQNVRVSSGTMSSHSIALNIHSLLVR